MSSPDSNDSLDVLIEHILKPLPDIPDDIERGKFVMIEIHSTSEITSLGSSAVTNNSTNIDTKSDEKNNSRGSIDSQYFNNMTAEEVLENVKCKCVSKHNNLTTTSSHNEEKKFHRAPSKIQNKKKSIYAHSDHTPTYLHNEENTLHRQHHQHLESQNKTHLSEKDSTLPEHSEHTSIPSLNIENIFHSPNQNKKHLSEIESTLSEQIDHTSTSLKSDNIKQEKHFRVNETLNSEVSGNYKQYMNVYDYAVLFVDDIMQQAEEKVNVRSYSYYKEDVMYSEDFEELPPDTTPYEIEKPASQSEMISILLIEDFTAKAGMKLISNIIKHTWNIDKKWSYCINNIVENSGTCADFYIYEVKWSLPNCYRPIPYATASVFFTIEVSRVKSKDCPVIVTYNFETERYRFTTDDDIQQEIFLTSILNCKLQFYKMPGIYYI